MRPLLLAAAIAPAVALAPACSAQAPGGGSGAQAEVEKDAAQDALPFRRQVVADFDQPWAMTFLPDGRMLVTEKAGRLQVVTTAGAKSEVTGVPAVVNQGQLGLHDVILDPNYTSNNRIYLSFAEPGTGGQRLAVARAALRKLSSPAITHNVARQSAALRAGLDAINAELDLFAQVRGRGLMLGAVLKPAHAGRAGEILDLAAAQGLLLLQAGPDVLRFVPALNITDEELAEGLRRLGDALQAFVAGSSA